ncbi:MAG TPA: lytic transglycosylase domain-containing protein [Bacteroidales bacterium]|nr:lytic transglycosylase domain-containing protein [Bacteroidales bacterium]
MKRILVVFVVLLCIILAGEFFIFSKKNSLNNAFDERYYDAGKRFYKIFSVKIPERLAFAGEEVPLDKFYVREGLDRELLVNSYWQSNTLLLLKRSFRYFPVMDSVLQANKVPMDFKYLALIESGLENIVSPAGAAGYWQFLKGTGLSYGLEINQEVDERYNLEKSTEAACIYLKKAYNKYHNWTLAAASYNMGMAGLDVVLKDQKTDNYYDLFLNKETQRYVYRILALKLIYLTPVYYGFYLRNIDMYPALPVYSVSVDSAVSNWPDFAKQHNSNYRTLKELNPWIIKYTLTNKEHKKYKVWFPKPGFDKYTMLLSAASNDGRLFNDTLTVDKIR